MNEANFLTLLRALATDPAARGLMDDAALLGDLVLTHDMLVEGVHYRPEDAPEDVAWKLLAMNLSDLAAKGAAPIGVLLGYSLGEDQWDTAFINGLRAALEAFDVKLLGGDTVRGNGPRTLSLTAIGRAGPVVPSRSGAQAGDGLWVTGRIGLAGLGLAALQRGGPAKVEDDVEGCRAYLRPTPRLAEGRALAPMVTAMMDVSDGLLIDAKRMADASGLGVTIQLDAVPVAGDPMNAVTAGDDYELLFALPAGATSPVSATLIGYFTGSNGIYLTIHGKNIPLPARLGWEHGGGQK